MTADARTWRVGIIGLNAVGLFLLERINLASNVRIVGAFDLHPSRRRLASQAGCKLWNDAREAYDAGTDVVLMMGCNSAPDIADALSHDKHVVIDQPWLLTSGDLRSLHEQANAVRRTATVAAFRRYSTDFAAAIKAKETGRLGALRYVRLSLCEQRLPTEQVSAPLMREVGFPWLDQVLVLVESTPRQVFARRFYDPDQTQDAGFAAMIEFTNGCMAQIEIRMLTRLSERTGWMLEGRDGSYRGERLFTTTTDGEIVDEPFPGPDPSNGALIEDLMSTWQDGRSSLPTLADASRVVQLIEFLERSADSGCAVCP